MRYTQHRMVGVRVQRADEHSLNVWGMLSVIDHSRHLERSKSTQLWTCYRQHGVIFTPSISGCDCQHDGYLFSAVSLMLRLLHLPSFTRFQHIGPMPRVI